MIVLHDYQQELKQGIYSEWQHGAKDVLAVLPTGGGKSVVVSDVVLDGCYQDLTQSIIAHRNELVSQMSMHIANRGIPHRIVGSDSTVSQITRLHRDTFGKSFVNPSAKTSVVGVDTLVSKKNKENLANWTAQHDRCITDEAHHVLRENKWGRAYSMFKNALFLGVTATACRADGMGLGRHADGVFDTMVVGPTTRQLINAGHLSEYEIVCPPSDLEMTEDDITASGDFSNDKMRKKAKKSKIVGDVVKTYCRYAYGKSAIVFATDVETAVKMAENFNAAGIRAAALSGETPVAVRDKFVKEFKSGKLWVLINVDLFDEGFDVPRCEVVIMARPTASLGKYLQMCGRGLRVYAGKMYGLLIDHVSNVLRHGLPDKPHTWTLDRRDKRGKQAIDPEDIPLTVCKWCTKPYQRFFAACPHCGMLPPLPDLRDRSVPMVDGDLIYLDKARLDEMRRNTFLETPADIGARVAGKAGRDAGVGVMKRQIEKIAAQTRLRDTIAQWAGVQQAAGLTDSQAYRKFYLATGMDVMAAMSADRSRGDYEAMATMIEGWYR